MSLAKAREIILFPQSRLLVRDKNIDCSIRRNSQNRNGRQQFLVAYYKLAYFLIREASGTRLLFQEFLTWCYWRFARLQIICPVILSNLIECVLSKEKFVLHVKQSRQNDTRGSFQSRSRPGSVAPEKEIIA